MTDLTCGLVVRFPACFDAPDAQSRQATSTGTRRWTRALDRTVQPSHGRWSGRTAPELRSTTLPETSSAADQCPCRRFPYRLVEVQRAWISVQPAHDHQILHKNSRIPAHSSTCTAGGERGSNMHKSAASNNLSPSRFAVLLPFTHWGKRKAQSTMHVLSQYLLSAAFVSMNCKRGCWRVVRSEPGVCT